MQAAMRCSIVALLVVGASASVPNDEYTKAFKKFTKTYSKHYASEGEALQRFENFKVTYDFIESENAKGNKYELGINEFSDQTPEEFSKTHFGYQKPKNLWGGLKHLGTHGYDGAPLADSLNWVTKGAVTGVKNQGQCGSCWSFSTTGALEGAWEIATGKLVSMSEEMLVDCSKQNHGCGGGSMDLAFEYVEKNGLCTEDSYPYIAGGGQAGTCKATSCTKALAPGAVTGFHDVAPSEQALMSALAVGPVSIAVEADKAVFQSYRSGVMTGMCGTNLDHGILAVGYGTDSGTDYWLVKNSWGSVWGLQGYGKLERGKGGKGECGILSGATYPKVSGTPGPSPAPPTPPAPPSPPTPPAPSTSHYEKPPCQSDEQAVQIQGIDGSVCSPKCTNSACPADTPAGTKDTPSCCLQDQSSGDKYCALECGFGGCPPGASCKHPSGSLLGICVYPSSDSTADEKQVQFIPMNSAKEQSIVV
jgi:C1A family cysteine protease